MNSNVIDESTLMDLVAQVTPALDERPDDAFIRASVALVRPHLETIVGAYQRACKASPVVREEVRVFMQNLLDAEA